MFDSHCHLHDARVVDADAQLARARAAGVRGFLLAGVDPPGWRDEERVGQGHADVVLAFGVHPQRVAEVEDAQADAMVLALADRLSDRRSESLAGARGGRVVAVGEIGLDALGPRRATLPRQERAFRAQLAIAREHDLPVALHVLRAHGRALQILARDGAPPRGGVVHSYSGAADLVDDYAALGLSLSFAGTVTRPAARRAHEAAQRVARERLLVETDAPDQAPHPFEDRPSEPAQLALVVAAVAALRGEASADVARYTEDNTRRLFGLSAA